MTHRRTPGANWQHRADDLAEWMAENDGRICEASRALGWPYDTTKAAWLRIRKRLGAQAR
jgi:hypothetical protein